MTEGIHHVAGPGQYQAASYVKFWDQTLTDFDVRTVYFRYDTVKPYLQGPEGLELGPADGVMTRLLLPHFARLTVVEGAAEFLVRIPDAPNLVKMHSLFEEFEPERPFNTVLMQHTLDFVEDPVALLQRVKRWLTPGGKLLVSVPNGRSIHRLVGAKMGLLEDPCGFSKRNRNQRQYRVYTTETLSNDLGAAGFHVIERGGVFFKPIAAQQIQDHWTEEMIQGFYELGKDFPEHGQDLYAICGLPQ